MEILGAAIVIGVTNGALIALIALGYTLVYGIIELINFAHGDLFMLGTFASLTVLGLFGASLDRVSGGTPWAALAAATIAAIVFCGVLNVVTERIAYRRLRNAPRLAPLISAIGMSFIFINIGLFWYGPSPKSYPNLLPQNDFFQQIFGGDSLIRFTFKDLFVLGLAIPLMLALAWIIRRWPCRWESTSTGSSRSLSCSAAPSQVPPQLCTGSTTTTPASRLALALGSRRSRPRSSAASATSPGRPSAVSCSVFSPRSP
jgi:branched-subunit amino acid ABC-type transport system permease component